MTKRGRKKTTGRYRTRQELEESVWVFYLETGCSMAQIARIAKVSAPVVSKILSNPKPSLKEI